MPGFGAHPEILSLRNMKTKLLLIFAATTTFLSSATSIPIAWDEMPGVDGFHVYVGEDRVGTVTENTATISIPDETVSLTVSAFNIRGEGPRSEPLVVPALPPKVKAYIVVIEGKITITITPAPDKP